MRSSKNETMLSRAEYDRWLNMLMKNPFDGFRDKYVVFVCTSCGSRLVAKVLGNGSLPYVIPCEKCMGTMTHTETLDKRPEDTGKRVFCRPCYDVYDSLSMPLQHHVEMGGILLCDPRDPVVRVRNSSHR